MDASLKTKAIILGIICLIGFFLFFSSGTSFIISFITALIFFIFGVVLWSKSFSSWDKKDTERRRELHHAENVGYHMGKGMSKGMESNQKKSWFDTYHGKGKSVFGIKYPKKKKKNDEWF
tara:strand:+ start:93 stop:452 length:360 start_codon:yes stop_codon:yes gene_type:complete